MKMNYVIDKQNEPLVIQKIAQRVTNIWFKTKKWKKKKQKTSMLWAYNYIWYR